MAKTKKKSLTKTPSKPKKASKISKLKDSATLNHKQSDLTHRPAPSILEYRVIYEDSVRSLEGQVNSMLRLGWLPLGGLVVQDSGIYMQSMVLYS